jgi:hypothetical protein
MRTSLAALSLLVLAACTNDDFKGTYLPREGDDGRYVHLGDSGQATIYAQGRSIRTAYVVDGDRLRFSAFGAGSEGRIQGGCVDFASATYCRRHYVHLAGNPDVSAAAVGAASTRPVAPAPPRATLNQMRSDLRNLVTAQEAYFSDSARYTTSLDRLRFKPSPGVSIVIRRPDGFGYVATATARGLAAVCTVQVGDRTPREAEPTCR